MALYTDIFGRLDWLTTRVKRLCCNVDKLKTDVEAIQNSGAGSYRVYTALLTQAGGSDYQEQGSGNVIKGVSYTYDELFEGSDFTNVGGPKYGDLPNMAGHFVATSNDEPIGYDGTVLSYDAGAPVANVLQNTIGLVYWGFRENGKFRLYIPGVDMTTIYVTSHAWYSSAEDVSYTFAVDTPDGVATDSLDFFVRNIQNATNDNDSLISTPIEIRIYN